MSSTTKSTSSPESPNPRPSKRIREDAEQEAPRFDATPFDAAELEMAIEDDIPDNPADPRSWGLLQLAFLLMGFVEGSMGVLDTKYEHLSAAREVLKAHPELRDILVTAWNKKEYDRVLNLNILRTQSTVASGPTSRSDLSDRVQRELLSALTRPYQGIAVDAFYEYLEQSHRDYLDEGFPKHYAKFCSIVQSSGTGKTRTILELARRGVLVLYMNLRPDTDKSGFPLRDDTPASILTDPGYCKSKTQYSIQCCAFFSAIFKLIRDDLLERLERDGTAAIEDWNKDMCQLNSSYRAQFFQRLQSTYDQIRNESNFNRGAGVTLSLHYYTRLTEVLYSAFPDTNRHHPKLVIALDEAQSLRGGASFRRWKVISQVIKKYSAPRCSDAVWVVFVATTSKVADFQASPQTWFSSSARVSPDGESFFPPFCQLGWDQHAPALGTVPPTEVAKLKHILRYGRPLWVSLQGTFLPNAIFDLALNKLIGTPYQGSDDQHALVVLAQRFGLDISFGHREAARFIESTVASHMRVCIKTTEDRLWSYTTYPSEPFLSCAAAHSMHGSKGSLKATLHTLKRNVDNGMIDIRKCGELFRRLFWLLAKDFFVIRNNNKEDLVGDGYDAELVHCRMVPVIQFFEFLFGNNFWGKCKDGAGPDAREAFKDAYVNFSHWISMGSFIRRDDEATEDQLDLNEWTMRHWQRTCAVQCCHDQPSINKVIPIYFKSANPGPEGVDCVSQILISDMAHTSEQHDALSKIQRSDPTIGGQEHRSNPLPYIAIVADLHLEDTGLESVTFPSQASTRTLSDAPCLRIHAGGLGKKSFPFFKHYPEVLKALKDLLELEATPPQSDRPLAESLMDQVEYGSSSEVRRMPPWERGASR